MFFFCIYANLIVFVIFLSATIYVLIKVKLQLDKPAKMTIMLYNICFGIRAANLLVPYIHYWIHPDQFVKDEYNGNVLDSIVKSYVYLLDYLFTFLLSLVTIHFNFEMRQVYLTLEC